MAKTASRAFRRVMLFGIFDLSKPTILYYVVLAGFLGGFLVIYRTINSPFGEVLKAIRENEPRAVSLGYKTDQYKLLAYILSGTLAGFAGSLKVFVAQNASLTDVHWSMSGEIVLMTLVGGLGTVFGPVVGAFVIIAMQQYLAGFGQWVTVIQGVIFVSLRADVPPRRGRRDRALFQAAIAAGSNSGGFGPGFLGRPILQNFGEHDRVPHKAVPAAAHIAREWSMTVL